MAAPPFGNQSSQNTGGGYEQQKHAQAVIPTTIRYMEQFFKDGKLGDHQKPYFTFVGKIREMQASPSCFEFVLDDSTGLKKCTWYQPKETNWQVGNYVRVFGEYREDAISVYLCRHLETKNEITYHILAAIKTHRTSGVQGVQQQEQGEVMAGEGMESMKDAMSAEIRNYMTNLGAEAKVEDILRDIGKGREAEVRRAIGSMSDSGQIYETTEDCFALSV